MKNIKKAITLVCLCFFLSGCLMSYLVRSGYQQMKLLSGREQIEDVLKNPNLKPGYRHKLEFALQIRDFAQMRLKLKPTNNYKTFVDIKRPYVTYIVTVAKKWQLEPELYWYPLVGHLPYKGFFTKEEAEEEAKKFLSDQFDVMVRGVSAYSTLGWFDDPLLSTMLMGEDHDLANLIIHESTHATLYFKSQAEFNERIATFMGNIGTELYYQEIEGELSDSIKTIKIENIDEKIFSDFISKEISDLTQWYKNLEPGSNETPRESLREKRLKEIQERFAKNIKPQMKTDIYKNFVNLKLNNAILLYYKTYLFDLSDFDLLYKRLNNNFDQFLNFCKNLEKSPDPNGQIKLYLSSPPSQPDTH